MPDAWRNLDGSYTLRTRLPTEDRANDFDYFHDPARAEIREAGGRWDAEVGAWVVPESALGPLRARRIFIVIASGYCCSPVARSEARDYEVQRGKLFRVFCKACGKRPASSTLWVVPIVEVCGEGEEGRMTYEAAFRAEVEGR